LDACQDHDGVRVPRHRDDQANYGCFDVHEGFLEREQISFRDKSDWCEIVAQIIEDWPQIEHECYLSDDSGPLIPLTTMMLIAEAVD
jgi:hypothetical protein